MVLPTVAILALLAAPAQQQAPAAGAPVRLTVGAVAVPPYIVGNEESGAWSGPAVELFKAAATEAGAEISFVETRRAAAIDEIVDGTIDASVVPSFATRELRKTTHLSPPILQGNLAIAVRSQRPFEDFVDLLASLFGRSQMRIYSVVIGFMLVFAFLVWLFERRRNPQFHGPRVNGLGSSVWWSMTTLSTVGYGDKVPNTTGGRMTAGVWMLLSLVLTSLFTAAVTSSLTAATQVRRVESLGDLPLARAGLADGSYAQHYFVERGIPFVNYPTAKAALEALAAGKVDACVESSRMLAVEVSRLEEGRELEILPDRFAPSDYRFVLSKNLPADFLARFDAALARLVEGGIEGLPPDGPAAAGK
ncbi:MAG: transporter substrate-binding domain-containing protein [Planctomycetaceae bacterium]|nr:transporter substrate-binding domain-containing protein [Planctomycetaceae bacterium]